MVILKRHWFKILAVVLLLYVIAFGLLVPLRPGIMKVDTFRAPLGEDLSFVIDAYNSHFTKNEDHRIWLRIGEQYALKASEFDVLNDRQMQVTFPIPATRPTVDSVMVASVILDNPKDGTMVLPDALALVGGGIYPVDDELWRQTPIENLSLRWEYAYPWRNILEESIRNTYFHVPMWFGMMILFLISSLNAAKLIKTDQKKYEHRVFSLNLTGTLFGLLGTLTGAIWARYTWGAFWSGDIKQDMTAITLLIFMAYFLLRNSMPQGKKRDRVTAVYTIFAFVASIPLLYIIPRMQPSLHPGSGGNPGFGGEDLDNTMRMVFYPAVIGWTLLGYWMSDLLYRLMEIKKKKEETDFD